MADGEVGQGPLGGPAQVARQLRRLIRRRGRRRGEGPTMPPGAVQALSGQEAEEGHGKVVDRYTSTGSQSTVHISYMAVLFWAPIVQI